MRSLALGPIASTRAMSTPLVLLNTHRPDLYDLSLKVDHKKANFTGSLVVSLTKSEHVSPNKTPDDGSFVYKLHSSELVVISAVFQAGGADYKAKVTYDKAQEHVTLTVAEAHSLYDEQTLSLKISYIGKINTTKTFKDITKGIFKTNYLDDRSNQATNYILATHCQTSYARCILPCIDEPASKAVYKLTIQTHSNFKVIANSSPESKTLDESTDQQTIAFKQTPPIAPSIFGFVIGDLDFIESTVQLANASIPVRFYTAIGSINGAAYGLDIATKSLPFIESLFDTAYPLDKLDIVALPFLSDGAMENHGLVTIQSTHILIESLSNRAATQSVRQLVVHELIHHWVGNCVAFDQWTHLWLNEAFATWLAYYVLYKLDLDALDKDIWSKCADEDLEKFFIENAVVDAQPVVGAAKADSEVKSTHEAFQINSYAKGIQFLRMLANIFESASFDDELTEFTSTMAKFINEYQDKTIKPQDLWKFLHDNSKLDLLAFSHSWLRLPGFPLVTVSLDENDKVVIEQHRYLDGTTVEKENLEDVPFHIPLSIKLSDGSVVNKVLNDRRITLEEISASEFVKLNTNRTGMYRVEYKHVKLVENIVSNIDKLSTCDLVGVLHDLATLLGHPFLHADIHVVGLLKIAEALIKQDSLDFKVLRYALNGLEVAENAFKLYADKTMYSQYFDWLVSLNSVLFNKLSWTDDYASYTLPELETRRSVLTIGLHTPEVSKVAEKLFKQLLHGPPRSVPEQLLLPSMSSVSCKANQNTWKKILELVKQPGATVNHIFGGSGSEIQHSAIRSLGYSKDPAIVKRCLNFVATNIDSTLVELALVGLLYNVEMNKTVLWDWFKLNYDQWAARSVRAGSQYSANLNKTLRSITMIVLSGMTTESDSQIVEKFVEEKLKKLPEHGLKETVDSIKKTQAEHAMIAGSIDAVLMTI